MGEFQSGDRSFDYRSKQLIDSIFYDLVRPLWYLCDLKSQAWLIILRSGTVATRGGRKGSSLLPIFMHKEALFCGIYSQVMHFISFPMN